ncbi:uncharacterized protein LOC120671118 [Panicum virgatum]|uniref:KIB1-4 beta-propeller domain-containing protein n=1 Tax=Panicum virgatum TaxID=38727 RepID=A0A8T0SYM3_PANVG|nr:uncharacterized protein LOC120671118 [Panicum virgatum]KAG2604622.1 hypothetical protein PVAP13_4NG112917 [Panicum virgatum]
MACGGWSSLPADLLQDISHRLSSDADHLYIYQVCTHWRASTSPLAACRPWVVAGGARRRGFMPPIGDYSLRLPRRGAQRMEVGAPPAGLPYCCGASRGWLALVDDDQSPTRLVLWEPLSNTEVPLPCLSPLTRIFLSDDPLASPNWIAVAAQPKGPIGQTTHLWRPGDAAWTMMYEQGTFAIESMVFHQGKAYYIDAERNIVICDFNTGADLPPECTRLHNVCSVVNRLCRCDRLHLVRGTHLVACNGELLLVVLHIGRHPSPAEVYKPEWTPNHSMELRERVMDLGYYSLFVGRGDTFALSAKDFPMIKRNCVYCMDRFQQNRYWISVFHLVSGVVEDIPYPMELKEDSTNWRPRAWFCPRAPLLMQ